MCYWAITKSGIVIAKTTVRHVTIDDVLDPGVSQKIENFNETLNPRLDYSKLKIPGMGTFALEGEDY